MRFLVTVFAVLVCAAWMAPAFAEDIPTHSRYIEYKVIEPCGIVVGSGEVHLEWADCKGDYELVKVEVDGLTDPVSLLFYAGAPEWCAMDACDYSKFFCCKCTKKKHDVYCTFCNPCDWYCYKTDLCWCGEEVYARAIMPTCMVLEIVDVY